MFSLNMTLMALELCAKDPAFEDMAIHCFKQFLAIAAAIAGTEESAPLPVDPQAGFFKDLLVCPTGPRSASMSTPGSGFIPLFATEVVDQRLLARAPRFQALMAETKGGRFQGAPSAPARTRRTTAASTSWPWWTTPCSAHPGAPARRDQFLSPHGCAASAASTPLRSTSAPFRASAGP